jgi:cytochrome c5
MTGGGLWNFEKSIARAPTASALNITKVFGVKCKLCHQRGRKNIAQAEGEITGGSL